MALHDSFQGTAEGLVGDARSGARIGSGPEKWRAHWMRVKLEQVAEQCQEQPVTSREVQTGAEKNREGHPLPPAQKGGDASEELLALLRESDALDECVAYTLSRASLSQDIHITCLPLSFSAVIGSGWLARRLQMKPRELHFRQTRQ